MIPYFFNVFRFAMRLSCLLFILLFAPLWLTGAELRLQEGNLFSYGQELYNQGEYYRAISEYQRLLFYFPQGKRADRARLNIARAWRAGGEVQAAITYLEALPNLTERERLLLGLCYLDLRPADPYPLREAQRKKGLAWLEQSKLPRVQKFTLEAKNFPEPTGASPLLAGGLSALIPGMGSAYLGRWQEASYAAFFTLSFAFAAKEAWAAERQDLGLGFGLFALFFYGGNIYSAMNSAHKQKDWKQTQTWNELRGKYGIWFTPQGILIQRKF